METEIAQKEFSPVAAPETRSSLRELVQSLTNDTKIFLRQEIDLSKTEAAEKVSWLTRNAIMVAAGGFVAYAGLIVLLIGLGWLLSWPLQHAGLQPALQAFSAWPLSGFWPPYAVPPSLSKASR